jgi:hypothetical protein
MFILTHFHLISSFSYFTFMAVNFAVQFVDNAATAFYLPQHSTNSAIVDIYEFRFVYKTKLFQNTGHVRVVK